MSERDVQTHCRVILFQKVLSVQPERVIYWSHRCSHTSSTSTKGSLLFISISKCKQMEWREVSGSHCNLVGRSVDEGRFSFVWGLCVY